jgi:competence protein ComEA
MPRAVRTSLVTALVFLLGAMALAMRQDSSAAPAPSGEGLPDGPGKDITVKTCGVCHEPRRAASVRLTRDGWADVIEDMVKRGAKGTPDELNQVLEYLTANFLGEAPRPLNINSAAQIDFESVLGLLRREAAAVVAYREKNGPFKAIDDLKNVPGLDFKKIDGNRDRIVCF